MNKAVRFLIISVLTVAAGVSPAFPADSIGKANNIFDIATGQSARTKLHDNGDGTFSLQLALVTLGGSDHVGKANDIFDINTGTNALITLVDNLDGTFSPLVSCPDCGGGGGGGNIEDTAYNSTTWNGDTDGASKNALRDYFVAFDSNGNGKVDVLDQVAGITNTNSSGVVQAPLAAPSGTIVGTSDSQTLTNKSISGSANTLSNIAETSLAATVGTIGDANGSWTAGKQTMIASAALTADRNLTLPAGSSWPAGLPIYYVDGVTSSSSAFKRTLVRSGSDTIAGGTTYAPFPGPGTIELIFDGVSDWKPVHSTVSVLEFRDPSDPSKVGQVSVAGLSTATTSIMAYPNISGSWTPGVIANPLSQFASTTSSQLKGVISDENAPDGASSKIIMALGNLSIASGKTATFSNTLTFTGTDGTSHAFPSTSSSLARTDAAQTFTGAQNIGTLDVGNSDTQVTRDIAGNIKVGGIAVPTHYWIRAASTVTQANDANPHAIFNTPANGRLTLPTGVYKFHAHMAWTSMSATSGNIKVDILGAGTATITAWMWTGMGADNTLATTGNVNGTVYTTSASGASITAAQTNTAEYINIEGTFDVTTGGTIIPTQTLVTAAAAVLSVGSYFECWRDGPTGGTSAGPWD